MTNDAHDHSGAGGSYDNPAAVKMDQGYTKPVSITPALINESMERARNAVMDYEGERVGEDIGQRFGNENGVNDLWQGLFKLCEEMGELSVVLNKLAAFPDGNYPAERSPLFQNLIEEITDVQATLDFFRHKNHIPVSQMRYQRKMKRYEAWQLSGIRQPE